MPPPTRLIALRSASRSLRTSHLPSPALAPLPSRLGPVLTQHHGNNTSRHIHSSPRTPRRAHNRFNEPVPDQPPPTDFARMDVLGQTPAPATSVDACLPDGFVLGDGSITVAGGSGALLVGGEAFAWRPWDPEKKTLVNARGQWDLGEKELEAAFGVLGVVWPRPGMSLSTTLQAL